MTTPPHLLRGRSIKSAGLRQLMICNMGGVPTVNSRRPTGVSGDIGRLHAQMKTRKRKISLPKLSLPEGEGE